MKLQDTKTGVQRVRVKATGYTFNLSRIIGTGGVIGLQAFALGGKPPRRGKHVLMSADMREIWLAGLEVA